jgi:RNA polymerase sigma-70 factor, ECF subfamily
LERTLTDSVDAGAEVHRIEPEDFDWIVAQHQRQVYRVVLCLVRDADIADALTQECFLRAFTKRGSFRGESSLSTWLVRIAINIAHDHNRSRRWKFWQRLERQDCIDSVRDAESGQSAERELIDRERLGEVLAAVHRLPTRQRTIFLLRYVEEMPLEAIAKVMDLRLGTVKSHLFRAVEAVRSRVLGVRR